MVWLFVCLIICGNTDPRLASSLKILTTVAKFQLFCSALLIPLVVNLLQKKKKTKEEKKRANHQKNREPTKKTT